MGELLLASGGIPSQPGNPLEAAAVALRHEDVDMTCDGCVAGIQASIDQLLSAEAMDLVVDGFVNSDFCDQVGGDERCPDILDAVLRQGLPLLAAASNPDDFKAACNAAKPGTCAARKMTIF